MRAFRVIAGFFALFLLVWVQSKAQPCATPDAVYAQMTAAYSTLDAAHVKRLYSENAFYMEPGATILQGRDLFMHSFETLFASVEAGGGSLSISFEVLHREELGEKVLDKGYYVLILNDPKRGEVETKGKFVTLLGKQEDGGWRFELDAFSGVR